MGRPKGERGIQKLPIVAFHKNFKLNLVFILILRDTYINFSLSLSLFFFFVVAEIGKNGII